MLRYEGLESRRMCSDVKVCRSAVALHECRHGGMWKAGGAMQKIVTWGHGRNVTPEPWRYAGCVAVWRHGALEVCCRRVDVEVCACRRVDMEVWRSAGGALQSCSRGSTEVWSPGSAL